MTVITFAAFKQGEVVLGRAMLQYLQCPECLWTAGAALRSLACLGGRIGKLESDMRGGKIT